MGLIPTFKIAESVGRHSEAYCDAMADARAEDQTRSFTVEGLSDGAAPDRLDVLVWAATALVTRGVEGPRIRSLGDGPLVLGSILGPRY